jgi:hypothetical protein
VRLVRRAPKLAPVSRGNRNSLHGRLGTSENYVLKVTAVETFAVKGLNSPLLFCAIRTDEGITGYSEFGEGRLANGIRGMVDDLAVHVIGKDPRSVEAHYI